MRKEDIAGFCEAAQRFTCWILVRQTNPQSLKYLARAGYTPKRIDCKAKTADIDAGDKLLAGLVVSAEIWPQAFAGKKAEAALDFWRAFAAKNGLEPARATATGYGVQLDPASPHYGCVTLDGSYICGDYDLFDIVPVGHERRNLAAIETLHGEVHKRGARVNPVREFLHRRIGFDLVQHGGSAQYERDFQTVDAFTPEGRHAVWTAAELQAQYAQWKRPTLGG